MKVWLSLFFALISTSFLWKISSQSNKSYYQFLIEIFRPLVIQTSIRYKGIKNLKIEINSKVKKFIIIGLLYIWLIFSIVLNKSFSGLLVNTYFDIKLSPFIRTIEDLAANEDLNFDGNYFLYHLKYNKPNEYSILRKRYEKFAEYRKQNYENNSLNKLIEVANKKLVLLADTLRVRQYKSLYPDLNLVTSQEKYGPNYASFFMGRKHAFISKIQKT